ncbi:MAG TPA: hypothetical protein VLW85_05935 [Myxococcales bacterium]|nr:hypothetical protein [Myxococcales bacterium]
MSKRATRKILSTSSALAIALCGFAAASTDHKPFNGMAIADCAACHRDSGVTENHGPDFKKEHRILAMKAESNCAECHQQSYCDECHRQGNVESINKGYSRRGEPMPHSSTYVSTHALDARTDPRACERCHQSESFCSDCHKTALENDRKNMDIRPHGPTYIGPGVPDPSWVQFHASDARRNLATCQGCHPNKADCSNFQCHPGLGGR